MKYCLSDSVGNAQSVYLIEPNFLFDAAWKSAAPVLGVASRAYRDRVKQVRQELEAGPDAALPVPHIRVAMVRGRPKLSFVSGQEEFAALKEMGEAAIPAYVESEAAAGELLALSFVKPLPPELKMQLEAGVQTGKRTYSTPVMPDDDPNVIEDKKRWAATNPEKLLRWLADKGWADIAQDCLAHYLAHGNLPPLEEMERLKKEAAEKKAQSHAGVVGGEFGPGGR